MKIRAQLLAMAANEIKAMIPPYLFDDIKRQDPKPLFKAFVVGHEGQARANWVGVGQIVKTWFADAIGKLSRKIYPGMKLFLNHDETNSEENRPEVGQVAGSRTKKIDGKFSAVIAAYIFPEYRTQKLDIASVEAEINLDTNSMDDDIRAINVENVKAIALGDGDKSTPGFHGAQLLAELQAMSEKEETIKKGGTMDKNEIITYCKENKIHPSDIFGKDELTADPVIVGYVKAERQEASGGEWSHRKRTEDDLTKAQTKFDDEKKTLQAEIDTLKTAGATTKASELFEKKIKDRKLDDKQAEYIKSKQEDFKVQEVENVEKEVDTFIDTGLDGYKKDAKIFGVEVKDEADLTPGSEPNSEGDKGNPDLMPA